ncbi:MAG: glycosyltransferase [Candidatus Marinimicrobia bacterium]|nr:glycosyltransferase [Candidatus Neomarinimicrobiota bacterium]
MPESVAPLPADPATDLAPTEASTRSPHGAPTDATDSPELAAEISAEQAAVAEKALSQRSRKGTVQHCAHCALSIRVIAHAPSSVCPFCQRRMTSEPIAVQPPTPEPPGVLDAQIVRRYRKFPPLLKYGLVIFSVLLLAVVVTLKIRNMDYFYYQPWVNTYSLCVGIFILSRFLLAAFYMAPPDVGYEPTVCVVVACRNEVDSIGKTIGLIYQEGYPHAKLEVVVVNDGSTDDTMTEMILAQERHPALVIVDFEQNKGKRHGMAVGALLAKADVLVYVDSDSFLMPGAIHKVVQGLVDPTVGAVSGHTDVENVGANTLSRMQDVRYFVSYRVMKSAESIFGAVSCCPGCFSAYRKACVLHVLDRWLHQRFMGAYATYGDDRSLTNYILKDYKILYDDEALATTIVPEHWHKYAVQQCRWKRSWVREMLFAGRYMWRKHPIAAISWYATTTLPLIAPLVMFRALVVFPLLMAHAPTFYLGGVLVVTLLWGLYYFERTGRPHWWTAFVFVITYVGFFSWQSYYAVATMHTTKWGTR